MANPFRNLPSVSQLLESPPLKRIVETVNHNVVVSGVRSFLDDLRQRVARTVESIDLPSPQELAQQIADWLSAQRPSSFRTAINGTGILLHTGLGRAPLSDAAIERVVATAGYTNLEIDLITGERGDRGAIVRQLLRDVTGAEDALVANNNAAATMLALGTLARGKEVIVSRGQLVEIGGHYRLPDIIAASGCRLREVGTTNKTRLSDYERAIGPETGALVRVHTSNYRVVGFQESVTIDELIQLGRKRDLPVVDDIGSGALMDFQRYGLAGEPTVRGSIANGADLVLFSGDKLLGGPQCGIAVGSREVIARMAAEPLMRAFRVDKLTLAALSATLELHLDPDRAQREIPLLQMLNTPVENLEFRARKLADLLAPLACLQSVHAAPSTALLGGGSIPEQSIPSWSVAIQPQGMSVSALAAALRGQNPSVVGRIENDCLLLDLRTIAPKYDVALVNAFERLAPATQSGNGQT